MKRAFMEDLLISVVFTWLVLETNDVTHENVN
jgi:hypothetical protein